jgi:hypothetical protein
MGREAGAVSEPRGACLGNGERIVGHEGTS